MPKRKRRGLPAVADLDLAEDLVRPMLEHGFRVVDAELVRGDQLHRALFFRKVVVGIKMFQLILAKMVSGVTHDALTIV